MTVFWICVAVLALIAAGFIVLPAWFARKRIQQGALSERDDQNLQIFRQRLKELEEDRKSGQLDETQFERLKLELERGLLSDMAEDTGKSSSQSMRSRNSLVIAGLLAVIIPLASVALYLEEGASHQLAERLEMDQQLAQARDMSMDELVARLEESVQANPDQLQGWYLLGRTYMNLGRFEDAAEVYNQLLQRQGEQATLLAQYAQARYFAEGALTPAIRQAVDRALQLDANEPTALGLLGIDAFENERYEEAITYWQRVLNGVEEGQNAQAVRRGIAEARRRLGQQAAPAQLQVRVSLSEAALAAVNPEDSVFIFARRADGSPMPLAAQRLKVKDLPRVVTLDDSSSPMGRLSDANEVMLVARVARGGTPQAQSGDWQGQQGPVPVTSGEPVQVLVDTQIQ